MIYQNTKTNVVSADRHGRGSSAFSGWVRANYSGKFLVSVQAIGGNADPLKNRGYEFSGDSIERGLLVGSKCWFKVFDTIEQADAEYDVLTEEGI